MIGRGLMALAVAAVLWPAPGAAVNPGEVLADPALERRAREISKELRCLVCQNQSIDDSDADLARDLRIIVRERLVAGDDDDAVIDFVVKRYGDFVLLRPPFKGATLILWLGPAVIAGCGLIAMVVFLRRRGGATGTAADAGTAPGDAQPPPLSAEEKRRLAALLEDRER